MGKYKFLTIALLFFSYMSCTTTINPTSGGLHILPTSYDFGDAYIGDSIQVDFVVLNNFKDKAVLTEISIIGDDVDDFSIKAGGITPAEIESSGKYTITVEFVPKRAGIRNAFLSIEYNAIGGSFESQLKGFGLEEPVIEVTPESYDYGNVGIGAKVSKDFEITNLGNKSLVISNIEIIDDADNNFTIIEGGLIGVEIVVNPGLKHVFTIEFTSQSLGNKSAKFKISHNAAGSPFIGDLISYASNQVSLSPVEYDFGEVEITHSSDAFNFTVSNPLSSSITLTEIIILTNPSEFTAIPQTSGNMIVTANGGTFEISVTFNPVTKGVKNAKLQIKFSSETLTADLTGVGYAKPNFEIDPTSYDYGTIEPLHSVSKKFTVVNSGTDILRLNQVSIQNDSEGNFVLLTGNSGTSINAGSFAIVEIRFHPLTSGRKNAILRIEHNAEGSPVFVNLTGLSATIALTPSVYNFGDVGVGIVPAASKEFTVVNATSSAITVTNIQIDGYDETSFAVTPSGNGSWSVVPGSEPLKLIVTCSPKKKGSLSAILKVTYGGGQLTAEISANGIAMPTFMITPESYNYGTVEITKYDTHDFIIRNYGSSELTISKIEIIDDTTSSYEIILGGLTSGTTTIPMNNSRTVRIRFAPKAYGQCSAKLHIEHNANGSPFNGIISGNGVGAYLVLIPDIDSYDFGNQFAGESSEVAFYLHNAGSANLSITDVSVTNYSNYGVTHDNLPILLEPGEVSVVKVVFHPTDSGIKYSTLDVKHTTVNSPISVSIKGTGKQNVNYLYETFEGSSAPSDWWATTYSDWQWGTPINVGPSSAYSGTRCYGTDINSNYRNNQNCVLVSPRINLNGAAFPMLQFYMWINTQPGYDGCWVEISTDDGGNWTKLQNPSPNYNSYVPANGTPTLAWSANWSSNGWIPVTMDLTAYKGNSQVRLLWYFYSNSSTTYPGVYIDNVRVYEDNGPDAPRNPVPVVNDISVPVISNSFNLKWDCTEGIKYDVYLDTKNPPTTKVASGITDKQYKATLSAGIIYYWQVVAYNSYKSTMGAVWYFKTVNGIPRLLINEIDTSNNNDYIEFYNTENYMVHIGKWQMSAFHNNSLQGVYEFPEYTVLKPGELIVLHDRYGPSSAEFRATFNINWSSVSSIGEVIWQYPVNYDSLGVDYMRFNLVVPNNIPIDLSWSGLLTSSSTSDWNWYRRRTKDYDNADDWRLRRNTADMGAKNPGQ